MQDLSLVQLPGRHVLLFTPPATPFQRVEVYRQCNAAPGTFQGAELTGRHEREALSRDSLGRYTLEVPFTQVDDRPCHYAVRLVGLRGVRSPFSSPARSEPVAPPGPPRNLSYETREDRIRVTWDPPEENVDGSRPPVLTGYLVNSDYWVTAPVFEDTDFDFGRKQTYRVQAVRHRSDPLILSDFSDSLEVMPVDRFPPAPPGNLAAVYLEGTARLFWDAGTEEDLAGYRVHRGDTPERLERISPLLADNRFIDERLESGRTYYYQVRAVDRAGNESEPSQMVELLVPRAETEDGPRRDSPGFAPDGTSSLPVDRRPPLGKTGRAVKEDS